jgi:very-short-patch-repair endonuclease
MPTDPTIDPVTVLGALGGTAPYRRLEAACGRARLRRAVGRGEVVRLGRGRYALPSATPAARVALADGGVLSHLSAAEVHGWAIARRPGQVHVTVPSKAHRSATAGWSRHYADVSELERARGVTDPLRTVVDCARALPLREALAVADSALRSRRVDAVELVEAANAIRGPGARRARQVLELADDRAANAFESVLRGTLLAAGITGFVPQLLVTGEGLFAAVDLGHPDARVALEADGYAVHGNRRAFAADLARHDELQSAGWIARRFAWEHVMFRPAWVVDQVLSALDQRLVTRPRMRSNRRLQSPRAA